LRGSVDPMLAPCLLARSVPRVATRLGSPSMLDALDITDIASQVANAAAALPPAYEETAAVAPLASASAGFSDLAEPAAAAGSFGLADPLIVFGGVVAGAAFIILFVNTLVSLLEGESAAGADAGTPAGGAASARPGFLRRSAAQIFSGGLDNLQDSPVGWLFGEASPLYSNEPRRPSPLAPAFGRMGTKEVARKGRKGFAAPAAAAPAAAAGVVTPTAQSPTSVQAASEPFGGRFASAPVATVPTPAPKPLAGRPVSVTAAVAIKPKAAAAPKPAPAVPAVSAVPAAGMPSVPAAAAVLATPVSVTPVATPVPATPVTATPVTATPATSAGAVPATPAPAVAIPASSEAAVAALTDRVAALTERNNQLVELYQKLQGEVADLRKKE